MGIRVRWITYICITKAFYSSHFRNFGMDSGLIFIIQYQIMNVLRLMGAIFQVGLIHS